MGEGKDLAAAVHEVAQHACLGEIEGHGFVANHMETSFEKRLGGPKVLVVRGDDHDKIEPVGAGAGGLGAGHLGVGAVNPGGIEKQIGARGGGFYRIGGEGTSDELSLAVHLRSDAVDGTDEGTTATADHAVAKFAI
jgi:hypothetical protein